MDYLLTFVELSLGLAGVAALIAVFRDHKKRKWRRFQFLGLIMHAMIAFVFSLLPFLVNAFTKDLGKNMGYLFRSVISSIARCADFRLIHSGIRYRYY